MKKIFSIFVAALFSLSMFADGDTWTVAGNSVAVFGTAWSVDAGANNDMTLVSGTTYQLVKENVVIANSSETVELQVCKNHAWDGKYAYSFVIEPAGTYTVTITFDSESKAITAAASRTDAKNTIKLRGNFGGSWATLDAFTDQGETATFELKITQSGTNYEFGVHVNGVWTANGTNFARENNSAQVLPGSGTLTLNADVTGIYTFTWTYATNTLSIAYPDKANVSDGYYLIGVPSWTIADLTENKKLEQTADQTRVGQCKITADFQLNDEFKIIKVENGADVAWYGTGDNNNNYKITSAGTKNVYFVPIKQDDWNGFIYVEASSPTALDNTNASAKAVKRIVDGQLVIEREGKLYNALGAEMK